MDSEVHGPVVGRRRLSAVLRRARDERGLIQEQVAAAMDWSLSKLIRIEKGTVGISTTDLRSLLRHYGIDEADRVDELVRLAQASRSRPWWAQYRESLPSASFETLIGLESEASRIEVFQLCVIPGLLQTEAYMRTFLAQGTRLLLSAEAVEARTIVRLKRQAELLGRSDPPRLVALLDEATLRRVPGDHAMMVDQLRHLLELAERPTVSIELIPFEAGPYVDSGSFIILSMPDELDLPVVYLENAVSDTIVDGATEVGDYRRLFSVMREKALSPDESLARIARVADEFV
jgi:transcriptional regulator with XRE-family HTH domain